MLNVGQGIPDGVSGDDALMSPRTVGVEEELMLVDPETCLLIAVSERAVRANQADAEVEHELFLHQIETSTTPCTTADDLFRGIRDGRHAVVGAAAAVSARAVAMATPVLRADDGAFTPKSRYRTIQSEYGELARQSLVCGMHMHVDISDDEEGVRVIDGIRPWLPLLVALSANSPYWQGGDTGHASRRSQGWGWGTRQCGGARRGGGRWPHRRCRRAVRRPGNLPRGFGPPDQLGRRDRHRNALLRRAVIREVPDRRDPGRGRVHGHRGRGPGRAAGPGARRDPRREPWPRHLAERSAPRVGVAGRPFRTERGPRASAARNAGPGP